MTLSRRDFAAFSLVAPLTWSLSARVSALARAPLVIAAGGATADAPAATRGAYDLAIKAGADVVAANVFPSKDGVLIACPGADLSASTDVATRPDFADRHKSRDPDDVAGWWIEDFTLAELKTLVCGVPGAKRRTAEPGRAILTLDELMATARAGSVRTARVIGIQVQVLDAARYASLDLAVEPRLATAIRAGGYNFPTAALVVASDDADVLRTLGEQTRVRRLLRMTVATPTPEALKAIRGYAEAISADAARLIDLSQPKAMPPRALVADAHAASLSVQAWTIPRAGESFPPPPFRPSDARRLYAALFAAGCDAVVGDAAAPIVRGRDDAIPRDHG